MIDRITERSSHINEAYTPVRTNMNFLTPQGAPEVLMFTSSVPSEGKSISSVGVATSFAQLGKRVLLIDADLRNSKLRDTLDLHDYDKGGLVPLLANQQTDMASQIIHLEDFGFDFLPMGRTPPNPVELLAGDRFSQIIEAARSQYDQVRVRRSMARSSPRSARTIRLTAMAMATAMATGTAMAMVKSVTRNRHKAAP